MGEVHQQTKLQVLPKIAMLSYAEKVKGQGVASAYREMFNLVSEYLNQEFTFLENPSLSALKTCTIVHAHSINPTIFARLLYLKKTTSIPVVMSVHFLPETLDGSIHLPKFAEKIFKRYVMRFYELADYVVTVNPEFVDKLVALGFDRDRVFFVPNYVDRREFMQPSVEEQVAAADEFHLSPGVFTVLGVGQVQTRKGVTDFVEVARKCPQFNFIWAGGFSFGAITDGYEDLKEAMDTAPDNVHFLGIVPRDHMPLLYAAADVLFVPSYAELFPMTILEAFASDLPVLVRDLPLYQDIVDDFVLTAQDNSEFVRVLTRLAMNHEFLHHAGELAHKGAERYSAQSVSEYWNRFYSSILAQRNAAPTSRNAQSED